MKESIIVLGMHRSGTSVIAGLVSILGAYAGSSLMKPTKDNPKGYFENDKIYHLNERILVENNATWDDYNFSLQQVSKEKFAQYVEDAKSIIEDELRLVKKIVIKDPRICLLFPIWEKALSAFNIKIKTVFVYRSPLEVARSLQARNEIPLEKSLILWSHYFFKSEAYSRSYERFIVEYDKDYHDFDSFLEKLGNFLDVKLTDQFVQRSNEFYTPSLKHHEISLENISDDLPAYFMDILTVLKNKDFKNTKGIDSIAREFYLSKKYFLYDQKQQKKRNIQLENENNVLSQQLSESHSEINQIEKENTLSLNKINNLSQKLKESENKIIQLNKNWADDKKLLNETINKYTTLKKEYTEKLTGYISLKAQNKSDNDKHRKEILKINNEKIFFEKNLEVAEFQIENATNIVNNKSFLKLLNGASKRNSIHKLKRRFFTFSKKKKQLMRYQELIIESGLFSPFYYLTRYPDVLRARVDPAFHYCRSGWKEGRNPSADFNTSAYLNSHSDVARNGMNPLIHYILYGESEGRKIFPVESSVRSTFVQEKINRQPKHKKRIKTPLGPQFVNRWDNSIQIIKRLKQYDKVACSKVPSNVIKLAERQLKDQSPKISVVLPTWNRSNSICLSVNSILEQSYKAHEIIIIDDGSTDNTIDLLKKEYHSEISRQLIKIIENDHQGVSAARNLGLQEAEGDLIAYLDSDNQWRKHYLLIMTAVFNENDELYCAYAALESNDKNNNKKGIRATQYNRKQLLDSNFIDLNVFVHKRSIFKQFGGFDTKLKRLVDWELIIRYTKSYTPAFVPFIGVDYYLDDKNLKNITTTVSLDDNRQRVYRHHFQERLRYGLEDLRLAYVLWDFPVLSQTFVIEELKWLVEQGYDVNVYYSIDPDKAATLSFDIDAYQVKNADELAELLNKHQRNLCHTHFAYPTTTKLTYPACVKTNIHFTFMPHAVDIFHHENKKRNKIGEIAQHPLCLKVFVHGEFHKEFIEGCGVPSEKTAFNIQAVSIHDFEKYKRLQSQERDKKAVFKGIVISRFVEKKGLDTLIEAAAILKNEKVVFEIYGYGPLEENYKKQIHKLELDNVLLKGALTSQQEVATAYQESDFLIAPCVVAKNGDMDGFPTVILEAMAVGLPVITTDIAAIPDYLTDGVEALVAPAGDIEQIAERVRRLITMLPERKMAMIKRAHGFLDKKIGVERTMQMLLDTWQDYSVDIFLVTFNTEGYDDKKETFEILKRIFKYTTTPFTLTIIDNHSDEDFWDELNDKIKGYSNIRLIRKSENQYCGPASNIALELSDSKYAIYICSKEGFIKKHGWERALLEHMRSHPKNMIAGHLSQIPNYVYGHEYVKHPDFRKFRNQDFAQNNSNRVFKHIQGGIYIIRREFVKKHGGFNPETPHGAMDIEMSYYMESLGYGLGEIPEVASITVKTLPRLPAILNERTVIAHPLTTQSVADDLDTLDKAHGRRCNVCGWKGKTFNVEKNIQQIKQICPACQSTGFGRSILKLLANSHHIFRNETCIVLSDDPSLKKSLSKFFKLLFMEKNDRRFLSKLENSKALIDCIILDPELISNKRAVVIWSKMIEKLAPLGEIVFADALFQDDEKINDATKSTNETIREALSSLDGWYVIEYSDNTSYCIAYDWRRFGRLSFNTGKD